MNRLKLILSCIAIFIGMASANAQFPFGMGGGTGKTATNAKREMRSVDGSYTKILANKGLNVAILQSDKNEIEVITDGCPTSDVITEVKKGVLTIKMKKVTKGSAVQVNVSLKDLESIEAKRGASISTECVFVRKGTFNVEVDAQSEVELELECDNLVLKSNSGKAVLTGEVGSMIADLRGAVGDMSLDAENLKVKTIDMKATSVNAVVRFSESLKVDAVGSTITYIGDKEKVSATTSYGGKVAPKK